MLDMQNFDVHLFKNLEQEKASQTFSICGGDFPELVSKFSLVHMNSNSDKLLFKKESSAIPRRAS